MRIRALVSVLMVLVVLGAPVLAAAQSPQATASDLYGRLNGAGPTPVLSTCGTAPVIAGNDTAGTITIGTGTPSACTLTFSKAYTTAVSCMANDGTTAAANPVRVTASSVSAVTFTTAAATVNGDTIYYLCIGR